MLVVNQIQGLKQRFPSHTLREIAVPILDSHSDANAERAE